MRIWVDCTAAAHPLVLRPIIARLQARGTRSPSPPASTGRRSASSTGSASRTRPWGARRRLAAGQGAGPRRPLARLARSSGRGGRSWRSRTARSTSPSSPPPSGSRRRRCRITSSPACSARSPSARRGGCWCPSDPARPPAQDRRPRAQAGPLPGSQGGLLPGRLRGPTKRCSASSALDRGEGAGRPPAAAGDLRLPRAKTSTAPPSPPRRGRRGGAAVLIPRTEGQGAAARALGARQPDRPRARDRRPEPDRLLRPRRQRRRHDEPRGGRARGSGLHDLQRPDGRRRRALIADGRLQVLDDPAALELRKRETPARVLHPRDPPGPRRRRPGRRRVAQVA